MEYCNFAKTVLDHKAKFADKLAVVDGELEITYSELSDRVRQIANYLKRSNIHHSQTVIIMMEDCVDWPCVFLACVYLGIVPMPLSQSVSKQLLHRIIETTHCSLLVHSDSVSVELPDGVPTLARKQLADIYQTESVICEPLMMHPDSIGYCGISSGSTGEPKIAMHRHKSFFVAKESLAEAGYGLTGNSVMLSVAKLSWSFGLHNSITTSLGVGATSILIPSVPSASVIFDYANKYNPTIIVMGPTVIKHLLKTARKQKLPRSVTTVFSSGEDLPIALYNQFLERFGVIVQTSIGMLEICATYATTKKSDHPGTVGKALPHCEIKIVDESGQECMPGEVGEIYIRTPMNAFYYLNNYEKTKYTFVGDWVRSGDAGYINSDNNLVFCSRLDDMFKVNDLTVAPVEVEAEIIKYPEIEQVAIVGVKNSRGTKEVHAFIIASEQFDQEKFDQYLRAHLFPHQIPKHIHMVDVFPETLTFKKDRRQLAKQVENQC